MCKGPEAELPWSAEVQQGGLWLECSEGGGEEKGVRLEKHKHTNV